MSCDNDYHGNKDGYLVFHNLCYKILKRFATSKINTLGSDQYVLEINEDDKIEGIYHSFFSCLYTDPIEYLWEEMKTDSIRKKANHIDSQGNFYSQLESCDRLIYLYDPKISDFQKGRIIKIMK